MKTYIKKLFLLPALIAGLGLILAGRVTAQTFTTLHNFSGSGGRYPIAGLILSGNTLYGTAERGGSSGYGTVFAVNTDGTGFTILHSFTATSGSFPNYINSDGANPVAGLILSGNTLYGTTFYGGSSGAGTVFAINTDGTGFETLHNFTETSGFPSLINSDGAFPSADLILSGNTLYGTTWRGGSSGWGTVFAVNTDGTGFTNLYCFGGGSDGARPDAGLILSGNTLYGTAAGYGTVVYGTMFAVNTDGASFATLHSFTGDSDGADPVAGLLLSGNTLYGTAWSGGSSGYGTVFAVNTDGTGFTNLHSFTATSGPSPSTNSDGTAPRAGLILSGNTLYGTANGGGSSGRGTVFAVKTDGTGFTNLHSFTTTSGFSSTNSDGAYPQAGLILSGNTLYGIARLGGSSGEGTIFSLSLPLPPPPTLGFAQSGNEFILSWPTNAAFSLQSAPFVTGAYTNLPGATSPYTNSMTEPQRYFRLQAN